ncbi:MAG: flagellar export chaperone FliS [Myxococcota bacterium]|nr:flagellar export chaperone FliS [Myxococcota bacterium]
MQQVTSQPQAIDTTYQMDQNPGKMLLTLYDAAIRFVGLAQKQIEAGNAKAKELTLSKAYAIIAEFINSLDHGKAPELCANLEQIYQFMLGQLIEANGNMDPEPLSPVVDQLTNLRDAWARVVVQ